MFYCFPLGNRLRRFPRSRSKPALRPPYVFFTPSLRKRKTPKQNICFIVFPLVIAFSAFQEAGQSLRFARPMFSLRRLCVNANVETKHLFYCFPLGNRLRRFPRSRSKPALRPPYVFFTPSLRKRKTPKQNICETNRLISWPLGQVVKTSPFHGGNMGSNPVGVTTSWGYSSAGRARALQARGHRFEPCCPHQNQTKKNINFLEKRESPTRDFFFLYQIRIHIMY